jgi:hypothetical protein
MHLYAFYNPKRLTSLLSLTEQADKMFNAFARRKPVHFARHRHDFHRLRFFHPVLNMTEIHSVAAEENNDTRKKN